MSMKNATKQLQRTEVNPFFMPLVFDVGATPTEVIRARAWTVRLSLRASDSRPVQAGTGAEHFGLAWTIAHFQENDHFVLMIDALWRAHVASIAPRLGTSRWASLRARAESSEFLELRAGYLAALGIREQASLRQTS